MVALDQFVHQMEALKREMDAGRLRHGEYDQRLARVLGEMRDKKLDADRASVVTVLDDLLTRGVITPSVKAHIEKRLGVS